MTKLFPSPPLRVLRYVALAALPASVAVAVNSAWFLGAGAGVLAYADTIVVPAEEAFLLKTLGGEYAKYLQEVPRWPWGRVGGTHRD